MVTCCLIVSHHARRFALYPANPLFTLRAEGPHCLPGPLSSNSFICYRSKILPVSELPRRMRVPSDQRKSRDLTRALNPLTATHAENRLISPAIATDPKSHSRNSFLCHTSKTPRGTPCGTANFFSIARTLRDESWLCVLPFAPLHCLITSLLHSFRRSS
jgi:hypothetical protein